MLANRKMKDSGIDWIGKIPEDWKVSKIKNYCTSIYAGGTPDTLNPLYWNGDIHWIPSGSCHDEKIYNAPKSITSLGYDNSSTKLIPKNTAVMAMTGATCGNTGYLTFDSCANQSVTAFVSGNNSNSLYLWYLLQASKEHLITFKTGGAQSGVNVEDCKNIFVPIVPISEQQKIADFLDEKCSHIDSVLEKTRASIEEYKQLKQSVITKAVTKGIRPNRPMKDSGIEWIGQIPEDWNISKVKREFSYGSGLPITKENLIENGVPVISYGQIHAKFNTGVELDDKLYRYVSEDYLETNSNSLVNKYDFIFADTSEDLEGCGNCVYISEQLVLFAGYHTIVLRSKKAQDNKYTAYLFKSAMWRNQITSRVTGIKVFSISKKILNECTLLVPPLNEQLKIVNYLDSKCSEIDKLINKKEKLIEELETYKKSLIYEYVTGKKEVC